LEAVTKNSRNPQENVKCEKEKRKKKKKKKKKETFYISFQEFSYCIQYTLSDISPISKILLIFLE